MVQDYDGPTTWSSYSRSVEFASREHANRNVTYWLAVVVETPKGELFEHFDESAAEILSKVTYFDKISLGAFMLGWFVQAFSYHCLYRSPLVTPHRPVKVDPRIIPP
jgi:hypothetical protein